MVKKMKQKIVVNMASESEISVQGHGVHTAYTEMANALEGRDDVKLVRGGFRRRVDCDVYHLHTMGSYMWRKIRSKQAKKVVSAHVIPDSFEGSILLARYWRFIARWYMSWFYNKADKVLAVSGTVAEVLHSELKVPKDKIEIFYNTIDMSAYKTSKSDRNAAREQLKIPADKFVVLGVGQVQPRKRIDIFDALAREFPDVLFIWVGGIPFKQLGAEYGPMTKLMESAPENLLITDTIPHEKVKRYLQAADVFMLPAEQENHPMCVLEAAGSGLPIVLRDIPEYDDTFANDTLRCKEDEFSAAITKLKTDSQERKKWQQKSKKIAQKFDSTAAADRLVGIYKKLVYNKE